MVIDVRFTTWSMREGLCILIQLCCCCFHCNLDEGLLAKFISQLGGDFNSHQTKNENLQKLVSFQSHKYSMLRDGFSSGWWWPTEVIIYFPSDVGRLPVPSTNHNQYHSPWLCTVLTIHFALYLRMYSWQSKMRGALCWHQVLSAYTVPPHYWWRTK